MFMSIVSGLEVPLILLKKVASSRRTFPTVLGVVFMFITFKNYNDSNNRIAMIQEQVKQDSENIAKLTDYLQSLKYGQASMYEQYCHKYQDVTKALYGHSLPCNKVNLK